MNKDWEKEFDYKFGRKSLGLENKGTYPDGWFLKEHIKQGDLKDFIRTLLSHQITELRGKIQDILKRHINKEQHNKRMLPHAQGYTEALEKVLSLLSPGGPYRATPQNGKKCICKALKKSMLTYSVWNCPVHGHCREEEK